MLQSNLNRIFSQVQLISGLCARQTVYPVCYTPSNTPAGCSKEGILEMLRTGEFNQTHNRKAARSWPRALSVSWEDFNLALVGKVLVIFIFLGTILTPLFWLSGIPVLQNIAQFGWQVGRAICSYTDHSLGISGEPLMVCTRCFGVGVGLLTAGLVYFYTPLIKNHLPKSRLLLAVILASLFIPWLVDSWFEWQGLWQTNNYLMLPTGFLGGVAVVLAPLIFWPRPEPEEEE